MDAFGPRMEAIAQHVSPAPFSYLCLLLMTVLALSFPLLSNLRSSGTLESSPKPSKAQDESPQRSSLAAALADALPELTFFRHHPTFVTSTNSYWSKQQRQITPECVLRPAEEKEISTAVVIIKREFDRCCGEKTTPPTFAVRSGGHSTVPGASNVKSGVVIDLSLFNQVHTSHDRRSVLIGCGARWGEVSRALDKEGLAVAGGRNSDVGVGGLTLGGGYSFFSPQVGFVCDNMLEYRVVLADGTLATVSEELRNDLWRALKGGGNNFGIVTSFRIRTFPSSGVWSGFLSSFSWKAPQNLQAFHDFIKADFDENAAGPLLCFSYVQQIGIEAIATQLIYTKPKQWPACWQQFKSIGRIWSTNKVRSLTSATDELDSISPAGFRQVHITTTITNDHPTLTFAHAAYKRAIASLKRVKGMVWTLVLQPLPLSALRTGKDNVFGLQNRTEDFVIVLFTAVWNDEIDDTLVNKTARNAIGDIDTFAGSRGSADQFRYLNWCDKGQQPFQSYGEKNLKFLKDVSKSYDPNGMFQRGCVGGFKLIPDQNEQN